jgi:hypothetical protein
MEQNTAGKAKSLVQDRFGQFADGYVSSQTHAAAPELDLLREMAVPQPGWITLDMATGWRPYGSGLPAVRRACDRLEPDLMMRDAPPAVRMWRNPTCFGGDLRSAAFSDKHILIAGSKGYIDAKTP